jgi:hypothetical protein
MGAMDDEPRVDRILACLFGIQRPRVIVHGQWRCASAASDDASAGRRRIDVEAARQLKRSHELVHAALIVGLEDDIEGVFPLDDSLPQYFQSVAPDIRAAQVIQKRRTHVRILGGTALVRVLMSDNE